MASESGKKIMGQTAPDNDWVAKVQEDIIDPELPIVDPHHHLWVRNGDHYLMPEFAADLATGHNVISTVYAECSSMYRKDGPEELKSLGETEFVAGCAAMSESGTFGETEICKASLSRVDMMLGEPSREVFQQHIERSAGRFRGIRYTTAWDGHEKIQDHAPGPEMLLQPEVIAAARVMADLQLSLDSWVYHPQLSDVATLAKTVPDLTIILNHTGVPILGGPYKDKREEVFTAWRKGIEQVAEMPNVFIKLGAFPIRRAGDGIDRSMPPTSEEIERAWSPWMKVCIDAFGPTRSMFESNFPVQKLFSSYSVTWNAFKRIAAGASADEKHELFVGAATRAYRLQGG